MSARITVTRRSPQDVGFREVYVSLDGGESRIVEAGGELTFDVEPGPHRVRGHNTLFWKTHNLVVTAGEHVRFLAVNRAGWGTFGPMAVLGAGLLYLTFERVAATPEQPTDVAPPTHTIEAQR